MTRSLYRHVLWLHPPAFRERFAAEMLWIFDEAVVAGGVARLFADGIVSLIRQWVLRSGMWKVAVAIIGGLLEMAIGAIVLVLPALIRAFE